MAFNLPPTESRTILLLAPPRKSQEWAKSGYLGAQMVPQLLDLLKSSINSVFRSSALKCQSVICFFSVLEYEVRLLYLVLFV